MRAQFITYYSLISVGLRGIRWSIPVVLLGFLSATGKAADCEFDLKDFAGFQTCFGGIDTAVGPDCAVYDLDDNGQVDHDDAAAVAIVMRAPLQSVAPEVKTRSPVDGGRTGTSYPAFVVDLYPGDEAIDSTKITFRIDNEDVTTRFHLTEHHAVYLPPAGLSTGQHEFEVELAHGWQCTLKEKSAFTVAPVQSIPLAVPVIGPAPLTVRFQPLGRWSDAPVSLVRYEWDFDGSGSIDRSTAVPAPSQFTYNTPGTYNATLRVLLDRTDPDLSDTASVQVTVLEPQSEVTARAGASPTNGPVPLSVLFSVEPVGTAELVTLFEWDWDGDGVYDWSSPILGTVLHTFSMPGTYRPAARLTFLSGQSVTVTHLDDPLLEVRAGPPGVPIVSAHGTPATGPRSLEVVFGAKAKDLDGVVVLFEWDFETDGVYDWSSDSTATTSHTYAAPGTYLASLRVTDDAGNTAIDRFQVDASPWMMIDVEEDTFNPHRSESAGISSAFSFPSASVRTFIRDRDGDVIRELSLGVRGPGIYRDEWDGLDDHGRFVRDGDYYAVVEYALNDVVITIDASADTGHVAYQFDPSPPGDSTFAPLEGEVLTLDLSTPVPSELTLFIATDSNFDELLGVPLTAAVLGSGQRFFDYSGISQEGELAANMILPVAWTWSLPDNVVVVEGGRPVIEDAKATPNYFDPTDVFSGSDLATIECFVSRPALVVASISMAGSSEQFYWRELGYVTSGTHSFLWDGLNTVGSEMAAPGDYVVTFRAIDELGNQAWDRHLLIRVFY